MYKIRHHQYRTLSRSHSLEMYCERHLHSVKQLVHSYIKNNVFRYLVDKPGHSAVAVLLLIILINISFGSWINTLSEHERDCVAVMTPCFSQLWCSSIQTAQSCSFYNGCLTEKLVSMSPLRVYGLSYGLSTTISLIPPLIRHQLRSTFAK